MERFCVSEKMDDQDEDGNKDGKGAAVCSISSRFFAFCSYVVSSGVLVVSWRFLRLAFFFSSLTLILFFRSFPVPFLFRNADTQSF